MDEEVEEEVATNSNARKTSSTSRNTKTNKSVSDSQAVERVSKLPHDPLTCSCGGIERL